jgi:hypothetical protein
MKTTNAQKDVGTVTLIVTAKLDLNAGLIIVIILEISLVQIMTAAISLMTRLASKKELMVVLKLIIWKMSVKQLIVN